MLSVQLKPSQTDRWSSPKVQRASGHNCQIKEGTNTTHSRLPLYVPNRLGISAAPLWGCKKAMLAACAWYGLAASANPFGYRRLPAQGDHGKRKGSLRRLGGSNGVVAEMSKWPQSVFVRWSPLDSEPPRSLVCT